MSSLVACAWANPLHDAANAEITWSGWDWTSDEIKVGPYKFASIGAWIRSMEGADKQAALDEKDETGQTALMLAAADLGKQQPQSECRTCHSPLHGSSHRSPYADPGIALAVCRPRP